MYMYMQSYVGGKVGCVCVCVRAKPSEGERPHTLGFFVLHAALDLASCHCQVCETPLSRENTILC